MLALFDGKAPLIVELKAERGNHAQLAENFFADPDVDLKWYLKFILGNLLGNFLTVPDFVAYRFSHRKNLGVRIGRKIWGVQGVAWIITSEEDYDTAVAEGWIPIFEGFRP